YLHLESGKSQIRLVSILPGEERDPIKCSLDYTTLGPNGSIYEALSYTWGSSYSLRSITLDNTPFHVTKNLEAALRHLRLPYTSRLVWIDAICINQEDNTERGEQVQIMRKIYAQAEQVLVWLGETSNYSELAMEFLEVGNGKCDTKEWFKETIIKTTEGLYKSEWQAIFRLQERDYWSRTWIVQELACAPKLELMCGPRSVSWGTFISCLSAW
ncbi:HET-domain-containing protein, partial [Stipitochalara longipes BDJ]